MLMTKEGSPCGAVCTIMAISLPVGGLRVLLAHALRLRHNRRAIEVIAGCQELLCIGIGGGFAALQRAELDESRMGVLPILLDEFAKPPALGLILERLFEEAVHDVHAVLERG